MSEWKPIETAPRDGTPVIIALKNPIPAKGRDDLERWHGIRFVARNRGDVFDWSFAAPVGQGGFPDEWIEGWMPIPRTEEAGG